MLSEHQLQIAEDGNFLPGKTKNLTLAINKNTNSTTKTKNFN